MGVGGGKICSYKLRYGKFCSFKLRDTVTRYDKTRIKILSRSNEASDINHNDKQMEDIMSNIVLTSNFIGAIKAHGAATTKATKSCKTIYQQAIDLGIDFTKETMSPEQIAELKSTIVLRFPPEARTLLKLGAVKADGRIAADHDGSRFNSQGKAKNWNYWNNRVNRIIKDYKTGLEKFQRKEARIAAGGNQTRTLIERLDEETNKLFNAVITADTEKLPDSFDVDNVLEKFQALAKAANFRLVRKAD